MATTNGQPDPTLHLPRILCLHGGGVTGDAFRLQARSLINNLKPYFRLVFADGPFFCDPGPGIIPVYADFAPFRRWLRWLPEHQEIDAETAVEEIWYQIRLAMDEDNANRATGEWVALMGFSQGAKMSASLLYDQQARDEKKLPRIDGLNWRFAVVLAGRAPLVSLSEATADNKALVNAAEISEGFASVEETGGKGQVLTIPTIHVHGLQDPGIHLHRRMLDHYCTPGSTTLIEWDGNHRVPIKKVDVDPIVEAILKLAKQTGVPVNR